MIVAPTWDLLIGILFILAIAYGFMLQREKVIVTLVSVYVGLVLVSVLTGTLQEFFAGDRAIFNKIFIKGTTSPFAIQTGIFLATIVAITARSGLSGGSGRGLLSPIELFAYSFFNASLIVVSILSFLPDDMRSVIVDSSHLATLLISFRGWLLVLPILLLVVLGYRERSER